MKQISEYILEKANFLVKKHLPGVKKSDGTEFVIMQMTNGGTLYDAERVEDCKVRTITLNEKIKPYVIYKDKYHGNNLHISSFSDMIFMTSLFKRDDFEDFGPDDIVEMFDTIEDAVEYAVKTNGKELSHYYDSPTWAEDVLANGETDTSAYFDINDIDPADAEEVFKKLV